MAEEACHGFGSTTQVGLTQALDVMMTDPEYLSSLGELATLKNALSCWFYLGALEGGGDLRTIARDVVASHSPEERTLLQAQINTLLGRTDAEIVELWDSSTDYNFNDPSDARFFFQIFGGMLGGREADV